MNLQLTTYEQAVGLKELNFDWNCENMFVLRTDKIVLEMPYSLDIYKTAGSPNALGDWWFSRPSLALAAQFLRDEWGLHCYADYEMTLGEWQYKLQDIKELKELDHVWDFASHDEALSLGITAAIEVAKMRKG